MVPACRAREALHGLLRVPSPRLALRELRSYAGVGGEDVHQLLSRAPLLSLVELQGDDDDGAEAVEALTEHMLKNPASAIADVRLWGCGVAPFDLSTLLSRSQHLLLVDARLPPASAFDAWPLRSETGDRMRIASLGVGMWQTSAHLAEEGAESVLRLLRAVAVGGELSVYVAPAWSPEVESRVVAQALAAAGRRLTIALRGDVAQAARVVRFADALLDSAGSGVRLDVLRFAFETSARRESRSLVLALHAVAQTAHQRQAAGVVLWEVVPLLAVLPRLQPATARERQSPALSPHARRYTPATFDEGLPRHLAHDVAPLAQESRTYRHVPVVTVL